MRLYDNATGPDDPYDRNPDEYQEPVDQTDYGYENDSEYGDNPNPYYDNSEEHLEEPVETPLKRTAMNALLVVAAVGAGAAITALVISERGGGEPEQPAPPVVSTTNDNGFALTTQAAPTTTADTSTTDTDIYRNICAVTTSSDAAGTLALDAVERSLGADDATRVTNLNDSLVNIITPTKNSLVSLDNTGHSERKKMNKDRDKFTDTVTESVKTFIEDSRKSSGTHPEKAVVAAGQFTDDVHDAFMAFMGDQKLDNPDLAAGVRSSPECSSLIGERDEPEDLDVDRAVATFFSVVHRLTGDYTDDLSAFSMLDNGESTDLDTAVDQVTGLLDTFATDVTTGIDAVNTPGLSGDADLARDELVDDWTGLARTATDLSDQFTSAGASGDTGQFSSLIDELSTTLPQLRTGVERAQLTAIRNLDGVPRVTQEKLRDIILDS